MIITSSPGGLSHMLGVSYGVNKAGVSVLKPENLF